MLQVRLIVLSIMLFLGSITHAEESCSDAIDGFLQRHTQYFHLKLEQTERMERLKILDSYRGFFRNEKVLAERSETQASIEFAEYDVSYTQQAALEGYKSAVNSCANEGSKVRGTKASVRKDQKGECNEALKHLLERESERVTISRRAQVAFLAYSIYRKDNHLVTVPTANKTKKFEIEPYSSVLKSKSDELFNQGRLIQADVDLLKRRAVNSCR